MTAFSRTRTIASVSCLLAISGQAALASDHPDGDLVIDQAQWLPATQLDLSLGQLPGPVSGSVSGSVLSPEGAPAGQFVFTGSEPEGDSPSDVAYTPDGSRIVIAHRESGNLIVWDAATLGFVGEVPLAGAAQALAITPDSATAVIANVDNNTVSIVDLTTLAETAVIPVGTNPGAVAISPDGDLAAVGLTFDGQIAVIDIANASIVRTIDNIGFTVRLSASFEAPATSIQYSRFAFIDGDRVLNADTGASEMQIIDVRAGSVGRTPIPGSPSGIAVSGDGSRAAITHTGAERSVTLIDTTLGLVIGSVPTPENLTGPVTLNGDGTRGVVAVQNAARVVDFTAGTVGPSLSTASINELLTTFDGRYAVAVGFRGSIIDMDTGARVIDVNNAVSTEHGAVSPVEYQVAMCSTTFGDDLVVADVEGASGGLLAYMPSGPLEEGDRCRTVALSPDGSRAVGVSIFSDTATIVDTASGTVTGYAPLGQRPSAVRITPDGTRAVVGNLDSTFASVVDLGTATSTEVPISRRAGAVEISPDGAYAYVGVVASGDGVWRIDLSSNTVAGPKIATGNMGGVGYAFNQSSGMAVSHDGARLAVAGSFDNVVSVIDTASWSLLINLPAGDLPSYVSFSPDDSRLYAANRNSDTVTVYDNSGATPVFERTISVGDFPWHVADDGQGRVWVNNFSDGDVSAYDISTGVLVASVPFSDSVVGLSFDAASNTVRVAHGTVNISIGGEPGFTTSQSGSLTLIDPISFSTESYDLGVGPASLASSDDGGTLAVAAPIGDGLAVLRLGPGCNAADLAEPYGQLNFFDVSAFLSAFNADDPRADINGDGSFNFFDVSDFLALFSGGCP